MNRPLPQAGELWQHFKGNKYWIIGLVNEHNIKIENIQKKKFVVYASEWTEIMREIASCGNFIVKDSETEQKYLIEFAYYNEIVIYPVTETNKRMPYGWARFLDNFMHIISDNNQEQSSNYYRFTKIDI